MCKRGAGYLKLFTVMIDKTERGRVTKQCGQKKQSKAKQKTGMIIGGILRLGSSMMQQSFRPKFR